MLVEKIDLYSYFNISKPENARGILTVYALDNSPEINMKRVRPAILVIPGGGYAMLSPSLSETIA